MIRTEMWLEAASGRSAISKQAPVPLIAECALLRRKRTAELANSVPSLLRSSPKPTNREPRCDEVGGQPLGSKGIQPPPPGRVEDWRAHGRVRWLVRGF